MNQYIIISKNIAFLFKVSKALTAAEKQRRYRQRRDSNQERRAEFFQSADRGISLINNFVKEKVYKK